MPSPDIDADRFERQKLVGAGGMGRVYRARDRVTGALVALKILDETSLEGVRFAREAAVLAGVLHPGVVRYVAHGHLAEGQRFLAMEWLDGEDLRDLLLARELSASESLLLVRRAAEAVGAAHRLGIVHRDLKPANLFLVSGDPDLVKVIDFGIARAPSGEPITRTGMMMGTPGYMAPEQARAERYVDSRADVFSLGCVLFRCLTGRPPFTGDSALAVALRVATEEAPRLSALVPDAPRALEDLLARTLARDPEARPKDGARLAAELADLAQFEAFSRSRADRAPSLTSEERRVRCVLVARMAPSASSATPGDPAEGVRSSVENEQTLERLVERHGGRLHGLEHGSLFVAFSPPDGDGSLEMPSDQAVRAARCALAIRAAWPSAAIAIAAGRTMAAGRATVGEAIERGTAMLDAAQADGDVRTDTVLARLLEGRFSMIASGEGTALRGELDASMAPRTLLGKPVACVGRAADLARLESFVDESAAGPMARAVVVTAPAGTGKTRLVHELLVRLAAREQAAPEVWTGRGDVMSAGSPFAIAASLVHAAARISPSDSLALRRQKLLDRVARHVDATDAPRVAAFLGEIAGVPFPEDQAQLSAARRDSRLAGDQARRAWTSWITAEARAKPLVVVLEDLHFGDAPSVALIDLALDRANDLPLLVIALARPEIAAVFPDLWGARATAEIKLAGLSKKASAELVRAVLGPLASDGAVSQIALRAGGNAFCLEELVREAAEGRSDTPPETALAMVQARLDRRSPEARRLLRAASVFGDVFWKEGVIDLTGDSGAGRSIDDELDDLVRLELVEPRGEARLRGKTAFAFRHALVRDAAYALLTDDDRRLSHARAGAFLLASGETDSAVLAEHFERGAEPRRALGFYRRAAQQALEGNDLDGALARIDRALACGATGIERGELFVLRAQVFVWQSRFHEVERASVAALDLLPPGSARWCQAAGGCAMAYVQLGLRDRFLALAHKLARVDPAPDAIDDYVVGAAIVTAYLWTGGLYDLARTFLERTELIAATGEVSEITLILEPSEPHEMPPNGGMDALSSPAAMGFLAWMRAGKQRYTAGDPWLHRALAEESAAHFRRAGDQRAVLRADLEKGIAERCLGDYEASLRSLHDVRAAAETLHLPFFTASAEAHLTTTLVHASRWEEAETMGQAALATCEKTKNPAVGAVARVGLAVARRYAGDLDAALDQIRAAIEALPGQPGQATALGVATDIHLARGEIPEALAAAERAMRVVRTLGSIPEGDAYVRWIHGEALSAANRQDEARAAWLEAAEKLDERARAAPDDAARRQFMHNVYAHRHITARRREQSP